MRSNLALGASLVLTVSLRIAALAQEPPPAPDSAEPSDKPTYELGFELKAAYRDSEDKFFPVPFGPADAPGFPAGVVLRTVDPGTGFEAVAATLFADVEWRQLAAHLKVDTVDLYDRNPTSTDNKIDIDEVWVRLGAHSDPGRVPERLGGYVELGKIAKFERQNDRHLESYGLVSTAFNRFEDLGLEGGADLGRHLYVKASWTLGNPVFMRDPDALAGDNGTAARFHVPPDPKLNSGIPILYDAEVEWNEGTGHAEFGGGIGGRAANEDGSRRIEVLAYGYHRQLEDRIELTGTRYGGDLDLLSDPFAPFPALHGRDKDELGANLWVYWDGGSLFGQYVDQEIAGLERRGYEGELAWRFELPLFAAIAGRQLLPSIQPAVRYSKLDPQFTNPARTPAPSFAWQWEKTDAGVRIGIVPGADLTVELAHNRFLTKAGWRTLDETLAMLRWRM